MSGPSAEQIHETIKAVLRLREERAAITSDIADRLREARDRGIDSRKVTEVCQWLERCDKHGRDAMIEAEALFDFYRDIAEGPVKPISELFDAARDKALAEMFAAPAEEPKAPTRRQKAASEALRFARISKMNRGEG